MNINKGVLSDSKIKGKRSATSSERKDGTLEEGPVSKKVWERSRVGRQETETRTGGRK